MTLSIENFESEAIDRPDGMRDPYGKSIDASEGLTNEKLGVCEPEDRYVVCEQPAEGVDKQDRVVVPHLLFGLVSCSTNSEPVHKRTLGPAPVLVSDTEETNSFHDHEITIAEHRFDFEVNGDFFSVPPSKNSDIQVQTANLSDQVQVWPKNIVLQPQSGDRHLLMLLRDKGGQEVKKLKVVLESDAKIYLNPLGEIDAKKNFECTVNEQNKKIEFSGRVNSGTYFNPIPDITLVPKKESEILFSSSESGVVFYKVDETDSGSVVHLANLGEIKFDSGTEIELSVVQGALQYIHFEPKPNTPLSDGYYGEWSVLNHGGGVSIVRSLIR